ncbi:MAG: hypothetical protein M1365_02980 [Actinobacteria bacterium]|nr:hypothetical protein [Actinomycetota bacterium]
MIDIFDLSNKVAVIIGGARTLRSIIGMGFGKAGARLALCDLTSTDEIVSKLKN